MRSLHCGRRTYVNRLIKTRIYLGSNAQQGTVPNHETYGPAGTETAAHWPVWPMFWAAVEAAAAAAAAPVPPVAAAAAAAAEPAAAAAAAAAELAPPAAAAAAVAALPPEDVTPVAAALPCRSRRPVQVAATMCDGQASQSAGHVGHRYVKTRHISIRSHEADMPA